MKPKRCEHCDLGVPLAEFAEHFKACESRTVVCERCSKSIQNKDYPFHVSICGAINLEDEIPVFSQEEEELRPKKRDQPDGLWEKPKPNPPKKKKGG